MADDAKDETKGKSESSGLADILEVAEKVGGAGDSFAGLGITGSDDDDDDDDDLAGFGGGGSTSLFSDDEVDDLPPAPAPAAKKATPPPPPAAKSKATPPPIKDTKKEPSPTPPPKPAAKPAEAAVVLTPAPLSSAASSASAPAPAARAAESTSAPAPAAAKSDEGGSKTWLMVLLGLAAVGAIVWFAVFRKPAEEPDEPVAKAPVEETKIAQAEPEPEPEPEPVIEADDTTTGGSTGTTGGTTTGGATGTTGEPENGGDDWDATQKVARVKKKRAKGGGPPPPEPPGPPPPPPPEDSKSSNPFKDDGKYSAECVLDPNKPGCEEYRRRNASKLKDLDAHLADKLSKAQIRKGVGSVKSKAKACGAKHGAAPDDTVRVKLSIEGETGSVTSAEPLAPHASDELGKCVAEALKGAKFDRFTSPVQGTTYPVTF